MFVLPGQQINKRRTVQDNVTAEFTDKTYGMTWGHWLASADTYGADRKWVLLKLRSRSS